jgi:hypothetical protein
MITTTQITVAATAAGWQLLDTGLRHGDEVVACADKAGAYAIHPSAPAETILGQATKASERFPVRYDTSDKLWFRPGTRPCRVTLSIKRGE